MKRQLGNIIEEIDTVNQSLAGNQHSEKSKHILLMILCCITPLILAVLLPAFGYTGTANFILLLICPVMHFIMKRGLVKHANTDATDESS
ncbi:DUF2933 domain-containing protein [Dendrosporobacter sp. 1207_IL3150]|uniref:DUF2933 domain-containing protein n=1 Tax=Dendrosporobacter sp. 1207_IL3150 TaxID=3084054 RepID=UPI002FD9F929